MLFICQTHYTVLNKIYTDLSLEILKRFFKYIAPQHEKKSVLSPLLANSKVTFIIFMWGILWVFLSKKFKTKKIKKMTKLSCQLLKKTANAEVATAPRFDLSILWQSVIWEAANEAVLNKVLKINKKMSLKNICTK